VTALLRARDARIDADDGRRLEGLDFVIDAAWRVSLVGDFAPLWLWLLGAARLEQGSLSLSGLEGRAALAAGLFGMAPRTWLQPGALNGRELLERSTRLLPPLGKPPRQLAREALSRLGAEALTSRRLRHMNAGERRVLALSHALLGEPRGIFVEEPFFGLSAAEEPYVLEALERAAASTAVIVALGPLPTAGAARAWLERSERVLVASRQTVVADGSFSELSAPAERYRVVVGRRASRFVAALAERGISAHSAISGSVPVTDERPVELWVSVGAEQGTRPLLEAALQAEAPLREVEADPLMVLNRPP
jgi:ABC-type multidrug transport system ATPase subunit